MEHGQSIGWHGYGKQIHPANEIDIEMLCWAIICKVYISTLLIWLIIMDGICWSTLYTKQRVDDTVNTWLVFRKIILLCQCNIWNGNIATTWPWYLNKAHKVLLLVKFYFVGKEILHERAIGRDSLSSHHFIRRLVWTAIHIHRISHDCHCPPFFFLIIWVNLLAHDI